MLKSNLSFVAIVAFTLAGVTSLHAADHEIVQKDRTFSQAEITIKPGDNLTFKNTDDFAHNVFSMTPGMEFDLRRQAPGASSTVPFNKEGVSEVRCSIHPKMKLIVTVKK